jgi:beta-galactosidase
MPHAIQIDPPFFPFQQGLWHGGDWNPDQWLDQPAVLDEDLRLMAAARCRVFSLGVFSWTALQPEPGRFTMDWLADALDRLHQAGRQALLATPSGAKPAWLAELHPEICRVRPDGLRESWHDRHNHCPSAPAYRQAVTVINTELSRRFGRHPAVAAWHIGNEFSGACYCPNCLAAFRVWVERRYGTVAAMNRAWGAEARNQLRTAFSQVGMPDPIHLGMMLDWQRFVSDLTADFIRHEIAAVRVGGSDRPVTTNFMNFSPLDQRRVAAALDFVSNDAYPGYHQQQGTAETALRQGFHNDLLRSLKHRSFLQIEGTPSTTNNNPRPRLKRPGMHRLEMLQALAHGADGTLYFQWRKSPGGREKFHGAVVDHAGGERCRVFQEVAAWGRDLETLAPVRGSRHQAGAAMVVDWEVRWALEASCGPGHLKPAKGYEDTILGLYRPLWERGIGVEFLGRDEPLDARRLLILPMLFLVEPAMAERVRGFVEAGGTVLATWLTGIVDRDNRCHPGWPGGGLRELFGIWAEEIDVLHQDDRQGVVFAPGNALGLDRRFAVRDYADLLHLEGAEAVATYDADFYAGRPALTRRALGRGEAWYLAAELEPNGLDAVVAGLAARAGLGALVPEPRQGLTVQTRSDGVTDWLFALNFAASSRRLDFGPVEDAATGAALAGAFDLPPWGGRVLRRPSATAQQQIGHPNRNRESVHP